ncbi:pre-mRNA-splicing factor ATP-dependent RNA helicase prp43 [Seiridium cupressi]
MMPFKKTTEEWAKNLEDGEINPVSGQPFSRRYYEVWEDRRKLPVAQNRGEVLDMCHTNQVMVVVSETGSGQTTQLAQYSHSPRLAARSPAECVALEPDVELGEEVGYDVSLDHVETDSTRIRFTTDALILHENSNDVRFSRYGCIIIDEAHERSLATDTLLVFIKRALQLRPDLKVIIISATLDAEKFRAYFTNASGKSAPLLKISGRQHQAKELFLGFHNNTSQQEGKTQTISPPDRFAAGVDYFDMALKLALFIHTTMPEGTIVVFLSGEEEVERCRDALSSETSSMNILPIYGSLPKAQQDLMQLVEHVVETAAPATTKSIVRITSEGKRAALLPVEPHWYRVLAAAKSLGCLEDSCAIVAIASSQYPICSRPNAFRDAADCIGNPESAHPLSDPITELNALHAYGRAKRANNVDMGKWCHDHFLNRSQLEHVSNARRARGAYSIEAQGIKL